MIATYYSRAHAFPTVLRTCCTPTHAVYLRFRARAAVTARSHAFLLWLHTVRRFTPTHTQYVTFAAHFLRLRSTQHALAFALPTSSHTSFPCVCVRHTCLYLHHTLLLRSLTARHTRSLTAFVRLPAFFLRIWFFCCRLQFFILRCVLAVRCRARSTTGYDARVRWLVISTFTFTYRYLPWLVHCVPRSFVFYAFVHIAMPVAAVLPYLLSFTAPFGLRFRSAVCVHAFRLYHRSFTVFRSLVYVAPLPHLCTAFVVVTVVLTFASHTCP